MKPQQPSTPAPRPPDPSDDAYTHAAGDAANKRSQEDARARGKAWPFPF
ncbi:hypothetical protein [Paucibacter sp. KBW04]|nr:hypothetical protein [Paucibacter sp. KBW04]